MDVRAIVEHVIFAAARNTFYAYVIVIFKESYRIFDPAEILIIIWGILHDIDEILPFDHEQRSEINTPDANVSR